MKVGDLSTTLKGSGFLANSYKKIVGLLTKSLRYQKGDTTMINRKKLVSSHNPVLRSVQLDSPLTVGNGGFAFSVDVTGMQTLYNLYNKNNMPLCTMSQWGWHSTPVGGGRVYYRQDDLIKTEFEYNSRKVLYPVKKARGNGKVYDWLRQNPHRVNLARIGLYWEGKEILAEDLSDIHQELHLYEGYIKSSFLVKGKACDIITICDSTSDTLAFSVKCEAKGLSVLISFPYGSPNMSASAWEHENHTTLTIQDDNTIFFKRIMDGDNYSALLKSDCAINFDPRNDDHEFEISTAKKEWTFLIQFLKGTKSHDLNYNQCRQNNQNWWKKFWSSGGIVDFKKSKDPRAKELERRIILSQYLSVIQCCGNLPPQETGLTCNSWHGKFHLEMHLWHSAYLPLWNQSHLLERSFLWYKRTLENAKNNAQKNGFKGARWPKQVAYDGIDSPSHISPLLVWQQSHIIYMLELVYKQNRSIEFLMDYWEIVEETTKFMCDFLVLNEQTDKYELVAPIIPAQEVHNPLNVKNPTFEIEYWRFSIGLAIKWSERLGMPSYDWKEVVEKIATLPEKNDMYLAHENCKNTFSKFNRDHPSMLGAFGLIPSDRVDIAKMKKTLDKVLDCWEFETMWGWDFAMMAMTAVRLGLPELAIDILLMDSPKNEFVVSGNNFQRLRTDLPVYLPGNGSLLLAVPLILAGYEGCDEDSPGIPKNGLWDVEFENIEKFPY